MRYLLTLILISTTTILFSQDIAEGLIAHYPFNGDANDLSEFENHGVSFGAELTEDRFGNPNSAYLFNGIDSYITVPSSASLESPDTAVTMSAWMYPVGYSLVGDNFAPILMKSDQVANSFMYRMSVSESGVGAALNNWNNFTFLDTILPLNEWHHIAVSFCTSNVRFYVNNELIIDEPFNSNIVANSLPLEIGRDVPGLLEVFNGALDDIRIYNRCVTEEEINELYLENPLALESSHSSHFSLSPNPTSSMVTIQADEKISFDHIQLLDGLGRKVKDIRFTPTSNQTFDFSGLKKGLYHLVIIGERARTSLPLMIN